MFAAFYVLAVAWAYGDDKAVCHENGYTSNSISLSLEGMCHKQVSDDIEESIPVENLISYAKRVNKTTAIAMCVLSGQDPNHC